MIKYKVAIYIRPSRDGSYRNSDCKVNELNREIVNDYIDKVIVYEEEKVDFFM